VERQLNLRDLNDSTISVTTTGVSTTNNYVVAQADVNAYSLTDITFIDVRGILLSAGTSTEFDVEYSDDASTWTKFVDIPLIGSNPQNFRFLVGFAKPYWRVVRVGTTDLGAAVVTMSEFSVVTQQAVASSVKLIDFSVESSRHYLLVLSDQNLRVFTKSGVYKADIKVPFISDEVPDVRDTQVENVMLMFHEDITITASD